MSVNHYQLLNIDQDATLEEIERAYQAALEKWQQHKEQQPAYLKGRTNKVKSNSSITNNLSGAF